MSKPHIMTRYYDVGKAVTNCDCSIGKDHDADDLVDEIKRQSEHTAAKPKASPPQQGDKNNIELYIASCFWPHESPESQMLYVKTVMPDLTRRLTTYVEAEKLKARIDQITEDMGISYESMRINKAELEKGLENGN